MQNKLRGQPAKMGRWNKKEGELGAVERIRTFTVLLPPAPQAGASASSATTANLLCNLPYGLILRQTPPIARKLYGFGVWVAGACAGAVAFGAGVPGVVAGFCCAGAGLPVL